jgi:hypothetical protein
LHGPLHKQRKHVLIVELRRQSDRKLRHGMKRTQTVVEAQPSTAQMPSVFVSKSIIENERKRIVCFTVINLISFPSITRGVEGNQALIVTPSNPDWLSISSQNAIRSQIEY